MNQDNNSKFVPTLPDDDDNSVKIFEGVAECTIDDADTFKNVKSRAKNLAQENVQKKISDYVRAFWKDRRLSLPADETLSIAAEISNITDVKYNVQDSDGDKMIIRAAVTAQVDDNDVMNYIIKFFKERTELKSEIENLRKENSELKAQNETLRKEFDELNRPLANNQKVTPPKTTEETIDPKELEMKVLEIEREAGRLYYYNDYEGAIKLYNKAIELNPYSFNAYAYRSRCYKELGDEAKAEADTIQFLYLYDEHK